MIGSEDFSSVAIKFVHTLPQLEELFGGLARAYTPGAEVTHQVEREFYDAEFDHGFLTVEQQDRLVDYLNGGSNPEASLSISVVTCSFLGQYVDELKHRSTHPWVRVDEPMVVQALKVGSSIGILATGAEPMQSTELLVARVSREQGRSVSATPVVISEAYEALVTGDSDRHNQLIMKQVRRLEAEGVEAIIFSQASMAQALKSARDLPRVPVFTSPEQCMAHLRELALPHATSLS